MYIFFAHYITNNTAHDRRKNCKFSNELTRTEILRKFSDWLEEERKIIELETGTPAVIVNCKIIQ